MTQAQHKAFSEACTRFGDDLAKIFGTEAPTMERQAGYDQVTPEVIHARNWEILEFRDTHGPNPASAKLKEYGVYYSEMAKTEFQLSQLLKDCDEGFITIHSVRRLSDNTVWKVGDKACYSTSGLVCEIQKFWLEGDKMVVETFGFISFIAELLKPLVPLFTTADGVAMSEGTVVWELYRNQVYPVIFTSDRKEASTLYSTQEAAEKAYNTWMESQPVLSFKDVYEWDNSPDGYNKLREIVKHKISKR